MAEVRREKTRQYDDNFFERIRGTAEGICRCLACALSCSYPVPHKINLELQHRKNRSLTPGEVDGTEDRVKFASILSYRGPSGFETSASAQSFSREVQINGAQSCQTRSTVALHADVTINSNMSKGKANSKGVSFAVSSGSSVGLATSSITQTTIINSSQPSPNAAATKDTSGSGASSSIISDFCYDIHAKAGLFTITIGQLSDGSEEYRNLCQSEPVIESQGCVIRLQSALSAKKQDLLKFSHWDRLGTAVALASSVLQLPESTWLRPDWERLGRSLEDEEARLYIQNGTTFALGIALIELFFCKAIEDLRIDEKLGEDGRPNGLTQLSIAGRLLEEREIYDRTGARCEDAVRRCVFCEFDQHSNTLDKNKFRRAVYEKVVALLEEGPADFNGGL